MNSLSWLLYAADVSDSIDWLFNIIQFVSVFGGFFWLFAALLMAESDADAGAWAVWRKTGYALLAPAFFGSVLLGSLVPEKDTIYAIAASEMGEEVVKSETAGKAMKALNAWLDRQIAPEKTD